MATKVTINKLAATMVAEQGVRGALIETGARLVEKVRASMTPGTGRTYKWKGGQHTASAPDQPPAPFSRRLHDSISYHTTFGDKSSVGQEAEDGDGIKKPQQAMGGHSVVIGTNVPYALDLEIGTKNVSMRPYLWPALKRSMADIKEAFKRY